MAMVLTTFYERAVTPVELAEFSLNNGYRDPTGTQGVRDTFFTSAFEYYDNSGINLVTQTTNLYDLKDYLDEGCLIIAHITNDANNTYTAGATQVVIYRIDDEVHVLSPNQNKNPSYSLSFNQWNGAYWFENAYVYSRTYG